MSFVRFPVFAVFFTLIAVALAAGPGDAAEGVQEPLFTGIEGVTLGTNVDL